MKENFKLLEEIIKIKHELSVLKKKKKKKALLRKKSKSRQKQYKISTKHLTNAVQPLQQPIMINPNYHEQLKHDAKNYLVPTKKEDENQLVVVPPKKEKRPPTPKKIVYVKSPLKKRMTQAFQYTKAQLSKLSLKDLRSMIKLRLPQVTEIQLKKINLKNKASMIKKFVEVIQADENVEVNDDEDDLNYAQIYPRKSDIHNSPFSDDNFGVNPQFLDHSAISTVAFTPEKNTSSSLLSDQKVSSSVPSILDQKESSSSLHLSQPLFHDQSASSSSGEHSPQFIDDHASTSSHPFITATVPTPPQPKKSTRIATRIAIPTSLINEIQNTKVADKISIPRTLTRRPKKEDTNFSKPLVITKAKKSGKTDVI